MNHFEYCYVPIRLPLPPFPASFRLPVVSTAGLHRPSLGRTKYSATTAAAS